VFFFWTQCSLWTMPANCVIFHFQCCRKTADIIFALVYCRSFAAMSGSVNAFCRLKSTQLHCPNHCASTKPPPSVSTSAATRRILLRYSLVQRAHTEGTSSVVALCVLIELMLCWQGGDTAVWWQHRHDGTWTLSGPRTGHWRAPVSIHRDRQWSTRRHRRTYSTHRRYRRQVLIDSVRTPPARPSAVPAFTVHILTRRPENDVDVTLASCNEIIILVNYI